jgi:hypothetical protein
MPVWGEAFAKSADPARVDQKIQSLVTFLESIQVKPCTIYGEPCVVHASVIRTAYDHSTSCQFSDMIGVRNGD